MISRLLPRVVLAAFFTTRVLAGEPAESTEKALTPKEAVKARMREDGKKKAVAPAPGTALPLQAETNGLAVAPVATPPGTATANKAQATAQAPTVMPKVEVKKGRITELDQQIAKQEHDIAREKVLTKSTEVDKALNDPKISKPLAFFGGESNKVRENLAKERVSLMEAERDIMEAMKTARTKEEKAELQKQLDQLKALRRDLEKAPR